MSVNVNIIKYLQHNTTISYHKYKNLIALLSTCKDLKSYGSSDKIFQLSLFVLDRLNGSQLAKMKK